MPDGAVCAEDRQEASSLATWFSCHAHCPTLHTVLSYAVMPSCPAPCPRLCPSLQNVLKRSLSFIPNEWIHCVGMCGGGGMLRTLLSFFILFVWLYTVGIFRYICSPFCAYVRVRAGPGIRPKLGSFRFHTALKVASLYDFSLDQMSYGKRRKSGQRIST